jgi:hypothetical protein
MAKAISQRPNGNLPGAIIAIRLAAPPHDRRGANPGKGFDGKIRLSKDRGRL